MKIDDKILELHSPNRIYLDQEERKTPYGTVFFAKVSLEPLERGFGHTIGNAMRRVLISSIPGYAVCGVEIDGASHELETIPGVKEDVLNIILNLKQLPIALTSGAGHAILEIDKKGEGAVRASDIRGHGFEAVSPDMVIANLGLNASLQMRIYVQKGFGYVPSERQDYSEFGDMLPTNFLRIDSIYSPVKNIAYQVHSTRLQQRTDMDRLVLSIETNGTVTPQDALKVATLIMHRQLEVFGDIDAEVLASISKQREKEEDARLKLRVNDLDLGVRALNCLQNMNIENVDQLIGYTEKELLRTPNLGRKSLDEIKNVLRIHGLSLRNDSTSH